jgi:hypothetical protein
LLAVTRLDDPNDVKLLFWNSSSKFLSRQNAEQIAPSKGHAMTDDATDEPTDESSSQTPNLGIPVLQRFDPAFLVKESEIRLIAIQDALRMEIKPRSYIERLYVTDMAQIIWEMQRLRSFKSRFIRHALQPALKALLEQLLVGSNHVENTKLKQLAREMSAGWFVNKKYQAEIEKLFISYNLDETSIEAEAWRLASVDLDRIERMLTLLEHRRDKVLKAIANYRGSLAVQMKQAAKRIIEADEMPNESPLLS